MALISPILRSIQGGSLGFWCPGCNEAHVVTAGWTYNGDPNKPTFNPSILVRCGHYIPREAGGGCWCKWNEEHPTEPTTFKCSQCHSFVKEGMIQFLGDCTHALAGQTVPIPPWPNREVE
jgi:hypothetical protein